VVPSAWTLRGRGGSYHRRVKFEWDAHKATANLRKHRVSFADAQTVFADPLAAIHDDPDGSSGEMREIIVGHSAAGRLLVVSFTERQGWLRLISAREATGHERRDYEEGGKV
jgi:uncharacterized protein